MLRLVEVRGRGRVEGGIDSGGGMKVVNVYD